MLTTGVGTPYLSTSSFGSLVNLYFVAICFAICEECAAIGLALDILCNMYR